MSSTPRGIALLAAAALLCGCAFDSGIEHQQLSNLLDEYERELNAQAEPEEVELLASDALGRRMDRSRRLRGE